VKAVRKTKGYTSIKNILHYAAAAVYLFWNEIPKTHMLVNIGSSLSTFSKREVLGWRGNVLHRVFVYLELSNLSLHDGDVVDDKCQSVQ